MKIANTTRIIELTVEESSVTIRRKRTIVRRGDGSGEGDHISKIEERTAEITTITTERDGTRNTIGRINEDEYR